MACEPRGNLDPGDSDMRWKAIVCMSILPFALARTARAQTLDETENRMHCQDPKADIRIAGCTAVIQSGKETHEALAVAFYNRGNAFKAKGEYDRAIQDYGQAIRLNPCLILSSSCPSKTAATRTTSRVNMNARSRISITPLA